jgi:hydroxymethylpyrimidine pyrophosphatase-like HAD family hydrolase
VTASPLLGLLLDVDGPIASPVTRSIAIDSIATDLVELARLGVPIVFNTGRSDAFITEQVVPPLLAAGLPEGARVHAVCEKGAVWFSITPAGAGEIHVDEDLALPQAYGDEIELLVAERFDDLVFFDRTKRAMVSVEQRVDVDSATYLAQQPVFDELAMQALARHGFGAVRERDERPDVDGDVQVRVDPTIISTDIESVRLGKDLGAERALQLLELDGAAPQHWRTVGDSRTDYAMATWLHERGHSVAHVDVRPKDGVPETAYPVLTAGELIHDEAGADFLARWVAAVRRGSLNAED